MTDGRDECLDRAVSSALEKFDGQLSDFLIHDDTGNVSHRAALESRYPKFTVIPSPLPRAGFGGAIRQAWEFVRHWSKADYVLHLEDDFTFRREIDLAAMADVLEQRPYLAQLALRRQAWNTDEAVAGGVVEQHPEAYADCRDDAGREWLEHRLFFTTNPSLYRRSLCLDATWPAGGQSEGHFTHQLLRDGLPGVGGDEIRFGFWGARGSGEWVEHIGAQRVGTGY